MNIEPLNDNVLIELIALDETAGTKFDVPGANKEKPREGTIVAESLDLRDWITASDLVGKKVLIKKWGGTEIRDGEKNYLLIGYTDVLAVVNS